MDDPDYFRTAIADVSAEMDRLAANGAPKYEIAATLSRCETALMRLANDGHHDWLCAEFQKLADAHGIVAHCVESGSKLVRDGARPRGGEARRADDVQGRRNSSASPVSGS